MMRVQKQDYSRKPWRVIDESGATVLRRETFDHPSLGVIESMWPACFDRKRDALAWVAQQEGSK